MTSLNSRKSQSQRKLESEEKLFNALIRIINRDGIKSVTCATLGKEAGLSRGMANQRLGNRQEMFEQLVERLGAEQIATLEQRGIQSMKGDDALVEYVELHFDAILNNPGYRAYFVLVAGSIADAPLLKHCVEEAHIFVRMLLSELIAKGQSEGGFRTDIEADLHAGILGSFLLGVAIQAKLSAADDIAKLKVGALTLIENLRNT